MKSLRPLLRHKDFRVVLLLVLLGGVALAGWIVRLNHQVARLQAALEAAEAQRRGLQERVDEERRRSEADRASLENRIDDFRDREERLSRRLADAAPGREVLALREELLEVRSRLVRLEGERAAGERIIREYGAGVCLIQTSYAFYDAQGRPLRYRVDRDGKKVREADGSVPIQVEGEGPIHTLDATGTGFLVDSRGFVVTNRHVVEPWWKDSTAEALEGDGYQPRLVTFRAFFPRVDEPLKLEVHRVSPRFDLALVKVDLGRHRIPALRLDTSRSGAVPGQPIVVVGYPTGLEAILAKTQPDVVQEIVTAQGTSTARITEALSRRGLIRPSTTQGHIGDVTSTDVVFDAATTQGGSGGPVFNKRGHVVAVEYAMLPQFAGNSYGVPARFVQLLLRQPDQPAEPRQPVSSRGQ